MNDNVSLHDIIKNLQKNNAWLRKYSYKDVPTPLKLMLNDICTGIEVMAEKIDKLENGRDDGK